MYRLSKCKKNINRKLDIDMTGITYFLHKRVTSCLLVGSYDALTTETIEHLATF